MHTILIAGGNLFTVAAQELGDATQWFRIAALNGLTDPMLYGLVTLQIPNIETSQNGGLSPG